MDRYGVSGGRELSGSGELVLQWQGEIRAGFEWYDPRGGCMGL